MNFVRRKKHCVYLKGPEIVPLLSGHVFASHVNFWQGQTETTSMTLSTDGISHIHTLNSS